MKPALITLACLCLCCSFCSAQDIKKFRAKSIEISTSKDPHGVPIWKRSDSSANTLVVLDKNTISVYTAKTHNLSIISSYVFMNDPARHLYQYFYDCVDETNSKCTACITLYIDGDTRPHEQLVLDYFTAEYRFDMRPETQSE